MYQRLTALLLRLLKVPHEPQPPHGDPASLQVFRAGRNLFTLKLVGWGFAQSAALAGIVFWLVMFIQVESAVHQRLANQVRINPKDVRNFEEYIEKIGAAEKAAPGPAVAPAAAAPTAAPG